MKEQVKGKKLNTDSASLSHQSSPDKDKTDCIACTDGNFPTGAHTCIECGKNVHIFDGCSISIGSDEGHGSKRICIDCNKKKKEQVTKEMGYEEKWGKNKTKGSKYMQSNPLFNIMSNTKKRAIGLMKNGNLYTKPFSVNKKQIYLTNTCAPDALAQALAGAYAYHPVTRDFYEKQPDEIVKVAILLATK